RMRTIIMILCFLACVIFSNRATAGYATGIAVGAGSAMAMQGAQDSENTDYALRLALCQQSATRQATIECIKKIQHDKAVNDRNWSLFAFILVVVLVGICIAIPYFLN